MTQTETAQIEGNVKNAEFAFLIIKQKDGRYAIAHVNNAETERQPTVEDVHGALYALQRDLDRQATAMAVVSALSQVQNSQSPSGLVVPEKRFVRRGQ